MVNGFHTRKELRIVIYEREGEADKSFVIVTNADHPTDVVVVTGDIAADMIFNLGNYIDEATKKGS